jgi:hypothetical protein
MKIDSVDLKIIRELENGIIPQSQFRTPQSAFRSRCARFESAGLIQDYKAMVFVPALLGGNWFFGGGLGITANPDQALKQITGGLHFLVEVWNNFSFPSGIGPNFSFSFYGNDYSSSVHFLKEIKEFDYLEVYKLREYSFPLPDALTGAEKKLLSEIYNSPTISQDALAEKINQDLTWTEEKIKRLISNSVPQSPFPVNDIGILQILPELNWTVCENFCHVHFIVENHSPKLVIPSSEFRLVLGGRPFREKFYQLESDLWDINQLVSKLKIIQQSKMAIKGFTIAESNRIINHWIPDLLT